MYNHRIMMTVDVGIYPVEALEELAQETREGFWEGDA